VLKSILQLLVCLTIGVTATHCIRLKNGTGDALLTLLLASVTVVLISPHSLFYDLGILLPAAVTLVGLNTVHESSDRKVWLSILGLLGINILSLSRGHFAAPPLALVPVIIFLLLNNRFSRCPHPTRATEP
jgi:hypothetical protein